MLHESSILFCQELSLHKIQAGNREEPEGLPGLSRRKSLSSPSTDTYTGLLTFLVSPAVRKVKLRVNTEQISLALTEKRKIQWVDKSEKNKGDQRRH